MAIPDEHPLQPVQDRYRQLKAQEPTRRERLTGYALLACFLITIVIVAALFAVFVLFAPRA